MKHYVYSARTTEKGLALLNKAKGETPWDEFVNVAVATHYGIPVEKLMLPANPETEARKKVAADKRAEREAKRKEREAAAKKKAADKKKADTAKQRKADKASKATEATAPAAPERTREEAQEALTSVNQSIVEDPAFTEAADIAPVTAEHQG